MPLDELLRSLLTAYPCGASGSSSHRSVAAQRCPPAMADSG
jgi:hypothetical protein